MGCAGQEWEGERFGGELEERIACSAVGSE
jgi:hypothetical protein